jgi:histidinol-phosphatase (PHP family)
MWTNFHMHSNFCDGKGDMVDYVEKAVAENMRSIGFSSHAPVPFDCAWCMKNGRLVDYGARIDELRQAGYPLDIYKGLEIDFIPNVISPADFSHQLDYTIGSIHFIDAFGDGRPWEIDGLHTLFLDGLREIFGNNIKEVISRYYELTREMITKSAPTIVGHLDKIKIQNIQEKFYRETDAWYVQEIDKTLDVIADSGTIVEVNTRGLYQGKSSTTYPSPWILERLLNKDVRVAINSDTHHPSDIINRFPETARQLKEIGFKSIVALVDNQWRPFSFSSHGIS